MSSESRNPVSNTTRPYEQRCAACRHDQWQNDLVGDCGAFDKDVYHHSVEACVRFEVQTHA